MPVASGGENPALVTFDKVTFGYGPVVAVEDVSFNIQRGDFLALVGPNGGGKTTLVRLALGLERPQHGRVLLFGQEVSRFHDWHRIGYVPQTTTAFTVRFPATVGEVVSYGTYRSFDPMGLFRSSLSPSVREALETVGMWNLRDRLISELSGGQQRRVLIALALVHNPDLLVLDEPISGVDVAGEEQFYGLLRRLHDAKGVTIVLVSHDIGVMLHEATKLACVNRTLVFHGPAHAVTDEALSNLYGFSVDLVIHRHG